MTSLIPRHLIDQLGWTDRMDLVTRLSPGFSGAKVYRVRVREVGEFALKRFPVQTDHARVSEIHRAIDALREQGAEGLPWFHSGIQGNAGKKGSVFNDGSHLWEASNWQPGSPLSVDANVDKIAAGAKAIAAIHRISMNTKPSDNVPDSLNGPLCITERIERLSTISTDLPPPAAVSDRYLESHGVTDPTMRKHFQETLTQAITILQQGWPIVGPGLRQRLVHWARQRVNCCFVIRDIHREHALFDDDQIGFIDFDAARIDTPALDLARWVGSFLTPSRTDMDLVWSTALAEYGRENPSMVGQTHNWTELVRLLYESGTWGSLANWVNWVSQGRQFDAGIQSVTLRMGFVADAARMTLRK